MKKFALGALALFVFSIFYAPIRNVQAQGDTPNSYISKNITTASTNILKASRGIAGCVVVGVAGAAGSTVKLYNSSASAQNLMATVDGTNVGGTFCYNMLFSNGLVAVVASAGAVPDVVVTWK